MLSNHSDECIFYIDESGDLGFGPGGSRFFTIAGVCVDRGHQDTLKRYVRRFKVRKNLPLGVELKANTSRVADRNAFCAGLAKLPCSVHYVVVNKDRVKPALRRDTNILYNYLSQRLLCPLVCTLSGAILQFDERTIKVSSGNSLSDYLRVKLWYEMNSTADVRVCQMDSLHCHGIQAADFVANAVLRKYEHGDQSGCNAIEPVLGRFEELFF